MNTPGPGPSRKGKGKSLQHGLRGPETFDQQSVQADKWTLQEKLKLLEGLKRYQEQPEVLSTWMKTKSVRDVELMLYELKELRHRPAADEPKRTSGVVAPIDKWLSLVHQMTFYEHCNFSEYTAVVFGLIARNEEFAPSGHPHVDWRRLYLYLAALLSSSHALPELSDVESAILLDLMDQVGYSLSSQDTDKQTKALDFKYQLLVQNNEGNASCIGNYRRNAMALLKDGLGEDDADQLALTKRLTGGPSSHNDGGSSSQAGPSSTVSGPSGSERLGESPGTQRGSTEGQERDHSDRISAESHEAGSRKKRDAPRTSNTPDSQVCVSGVRGSNTDTLDPPYPAPRDGRGGPNVWSTNTDPNTPDTPTGDFQGEPSVSNTHRDEHTRSNTSAEDFQEEFSVSSTPTEDYYQGQQRVSNSNSLHNTPALGDNPRPPRRSNTLENDTPDIVSPQGTLDVTTKDAARDGKDKDCKQLPGEFVKPKLFTLNPLCLPDHLLAIKRRKLNL